MPTIISGDGTITGLTTTGISSVQNLPAGSVLQVVNSTTATQVTSASGTFIDTTLTATITPKFVTSKILVLVNQTGCAKTGSDTTLQLQLVRNSTFLFEFESSGGWDGTTGVNAFGSCSTSYLDSPATTSATTYKTQMASFSPTSATHTQYNVGSGTPTSTITLLEIAS